ncbi:MAG: hypothetical protein ACLUS6_09810, partial [Dysosmobacter sp.]
MWCSSGSPEDEIDWTTFPVDPEEDDNDPEGGGDGSDSPSGVRSGEDSKRDPDAVPAGAQERADRLLTGNLEADGDSALTLADVIQDSFCMEECCEKKADL